MTGLSSNLGRSLGTLASQENRLLRRNIDPVLAVINSGESMQVMAEMLSKLPDIGDVVALTTAFSNNVMNGAKPRTMFGRFMAYVVNWGALSAPSTTITNISSVAATQMWALGPEAVGTGIIQGVKRVLHGKSFQMRDELKIISAEIFGMMEGFKHGARLGAHALQDIKHSLGLGKGASKQGLEALAIFSKHKKTEGLHA